MCSPGFSFSAGSNERLFASVISLFNEEPLKLTVVKEQFLMNCALPWPGIDWRHFLFPRPVDPVFASAMGIVLTGIVALPHICDHFLMSFIGEYVALAMLMLRRRSVA